MRNEQEPVEVAENGPIGGTRSSHPAYGQIQANRVTGTTTLYGSDFYHQHFVTITIRTSTLHRGLSHDSHFAGKELIEVALSEAQWATFVSSMNAGMGVPCTLEHVGGDTRPSIPLRRVEDVARQEVRDKLKGVASDLAEAIADIEGELGQSVSKVKREAILARMRAAQRKVGDSLPFAAKAFEKHMEGTVEKAKIEVAAYMGAAIQRAGLEALGATPLLLESGSPDAHP